MTPLVSQGLWEALLATEGKAFQTEKSTSELYTMPKVNGFLFIFKKVNCKQFNNLIVQKHFTFEQKT